MNFRKARLAAGLTVRDVVRALGVSDAAVYMWETGKMTPTAKRLVAVAQLYGCTVDDLLKENDSFDL